MGALERLQPQIHDTRESHDLVLSSPQSIVYAGSSSRRSIFLQSAFPSQTHYSILIGSEPAVDIAQVVHHKLDVACEQGVPQDTCVAVIAADTNTVIPTFDHLTQGITLSSKGKPTGFEEVRHAFHQIAKVAEVRNEPPFYLVDSASAMLHLNSSRHLVTDREACVIVLEEGGLRELGDEKGFEKYLREFQAFYSRPPYTTHDMEIGITDLSGGISLPVLVKMGLVTSVNGIARTDGRFRDVLQYGIHTAAIGVSPRILNTVQINGEEMIKNWPWLNSVVDSALSNN